MNLAFGRATDCGNLGDGKAPDAIDFNLGATGDTPCLVGRFLPPKLKVLLSHLRQV
jgi:hypothetical protein